MADYDVWAFLLQATNYTMAFDYDSNGNLIYTGWTQPGQAKTDTGWRIMKQLFDSSNRPTDILWPNNSTAFDFVWALRTTYTYGTTSVVPPPTTLFSAFILTSPNTTRWSIVVDPTGDLDSVPAASGPTGAYDVGSLTLIDSLSVQWSVTIQDTGNLVTTVGAGPFPLNSLSLFDSGGRTWVLTVDTTGHLVTT